MKYSQGEFAITASQERNLRNKLAAFAREAHPRKAIHLTMVAMNGLKRNKHSDAIVQSEVNIGEMLERL